MILAAGLGTRLHPLTDDRPKALVEIYGTPLLELAINRLVDAGAGHIVVNVHHFADMVEDFIASRQWPCRISISDERAMLLDTGGALRHAAPLFERREPVLVHNVDVLSRIDLRDLVRFHSESHNQATLCVSRRSTRRLLAFDAEGRLLGRTTEDAVLDDGCEALAFSGIAVVSPHLLRRLPQARQPYPIIDEYIRLSRLGERVVAYRHDASQWLDVGTPEKLQSAKQWILS